MNTVRWANPEKTAVRVETDTTIRVFEANRALPEWQDIAAQVEAGGLTIADYEPPQPQAQD